jgi:fructokinase
MAGIVSVGEILWDVFPNAEHLGGAAFNFAAHAVRLGHRVWFVSAVGDDERGRKALEEARRLGVNTRYVGVVSGPATGTVTVTLDRDGQPAFVIHRPAAYDQAALTASDLEELSRSAPDWIYYGTLFALEPNGKRLIRTLVEALPGAERFYDVNLRKDSYTPELVAELLARASAVKLNDGEAEALAEMLELPAAGPEEFCRALSGRFGLRAVCVTHGAGGCSLLAGEEFVRAGGYPVPVADTVGAGDAFSAALVHGLSAGWDARQVADFANRVGALVASRPGGTPLWTVEEALALTPATAGGQGL